MSRNVFILVLSLAFLCFLATESEAGWLADKIKDAGKDLGGQLVDDASDASYKATIEESPETAAGEDGEIEEEENADDIPWGNQRPAKKPRKAVSTASIRTDLHFSADSEIIDPEAGGTPAFGQMHVDGARLRWDMAMKDDDGSVNRSSVIITGANPDDKIYTLLHGQKMYMVSTVTEMEEDYWGSMRALDNPCEGYRNSRNQGQETLNGRVATRWDCAEPEDPEYPERTTFWVDNKLGVPVREKSSDGSIYELKNIKENRPPSGKFELPAGYREFSWGK